MSDPNVLTLDNIRDFMLSKGGKVTNHELVKHFKNVLTNPYTRDESRSLFKEIVNTIATITRDEYGAKQLVLKKKYRPPEIYSSETEGEGYSTSPVPALTPLQLNLNYTPVYQTASETSSIGESLGSPLSLKSVPVYHAEDTTDISRRPSQDSIGSYGSRTSYKSGSRSPSRASSVYYTSSTETSLVSERDRKHRSPPSSVTSASYRTQTSYDDSSVSFTPLQSRRSPKSMRKEGKDPGPGISWNKQTRRDYRADNPIPKKSDMSEDTSGATDSDYFRPPVPPRRKSADKLVDNTSNGSTVTVAGRSPTPKSTNLDDESSVSKDGQRENVTQISVKERSQKFDRMASESALNKLTSHNLNVGHKKKHDKTDKDDEDTGSVQLLDGKTREWLVKCAQGDYQAIFKLVTENPKLVKFKDPTSGYTALHWGAKHGNLDIIKLIAGTHKADVNARTNGGYTPLHLATQLGHEEACTQLVKVYKADENIRDYSGRKPRQYQKTSGTSISADTYRKIKARKKHAAEKDLGFLRIGSLNVRVKKTTEAFSNFLGVGNAEKLHKHWGSADNLPQGDQKRMPPPKIAPIKKRKSKRGQDFTATKPTVIEHQQPAVPLNEPNVQQQDSDSDTAAGFGSTWQSTV